MSFEEEEGGEEEEESLEIEEETAAASGVGVSSRGSASSSRQSGSSMAALVVGGAALAAVAAVKLVWGRGRGRTRRYLVEKLDLEPAPCPLPPHSPLPLTGRSFVFDETIAKRANCVELLRKAGARGVAKVRKESAAAAVKDDCCDLALGSLGAGAAATVVFGMKGTDGTCWFAKDVALLRQAGHVLLQAKEGVEPKCPGKFLIASDLFSDSPLLLVAQRACQKLLGSANVAIVKLSNFLSKRQGEGEEALGDALNDALGRGKLLVVPTLALVPGTSTLPCISLGKVGISLIGARGSDLLLLDTAHAVSSLAAEAYEKCKDAGSLRKDGANSLKEQGNRAFRDGEFFEAVQFYSQGIGVDSSNPVLYSNRAMAYLKLGNFVEAERDCTLALDIDPSNVKALLRRGTARAYLAEFHGALNDFSKVMEVEPSNAQAMQEIGRIKQAFATPTPQEG